MRQKAAPHAALQSDCVAGKLSYYGQGFHALLIEYSVALWDSRLQS